MLNRMLNLFGSPEPTGPQEIVRAFTPSDRPIDATLMVPAEAGWQITATEPRTVHLFEISEPDSEQCQLAFRAMLRGAHLTKRAYLELWCRFPGRGEYFSKGLYQALIGTTGWISCETPFYLKRHQRPDLLRLNLVLEGTGSVWIKNIEVWKTPLNI
ncbi:MAG: hypothetical protein ACREEE_10930 [Dongiaceae bacterium]